MDENAGDASEQLALALGNLRAASWLLARGLRDGARATLVGANLERVADWAERRTVQQRWEGLLLAARGRAGEYLRSINEMLAEPLQLAHRADIVRLEKRLAHLERRLGALSKEREA